MSQTDLVLSVPAGKTYDLILEHFIYSCPDDSRYAYDDSDLITFRRADGTMERLFKIARVVQAVPMDIHATYGLPVGLQERIAGYISVARNKRVIQDPGQPFRFYILEEDDV